MSDQAKPVITAGRALYDEMLAEYQREVDLAKSTMTYSAIQFADSKKDSDHIAYVIGKARMEAAERAMTVLTRRGGILIRLDATK